MVHFTLSLNCFVLIDYSPRGGLVCEVLVFKEEREVCNSIGSSTDSDGSCSGGMIWVSTENLDVILAIKVECVRVVRRYYGVCPSVWLDDFIVWTNGIK